VNGFQQIAIQNHCRLAGECAQQKFVHPRRDGMSVVLTVNSGYE
jgi:hypothetical protein